MFCKEVRLYVQKLIRMQQVIEQKGYRRINQPTVSQAREHLKKYLDYYRYDSDDQMRQFWERNRPYIRTLILCENHLAYQKLMNEFIEMNHLI